MSLLVACGDGDNTPATLTFDQAISATQTAIAFQEELVVAMQATQVAIVQATQVAIVQATQQAIDDATATQVVIVRVTQQAIDDATATQVVIVRVTQQAIDDATATQRANLGFVAHNEDWTPQEQDFDGVTMVLVPAGCFLMGTKDGYNDEQPAHEQCFETPFWMDKYEVTQAQFIQFGGQKANPNEFTEDNHPAENITWFEARDYCELRGGRLPTEREWEYAARGPSNLIYPWGNEFVADNVVYRDNNNNQIANVGSRPNGVSWVGAMDMSGNVWEWVSSFYGDYPYDENDESVSDNNTDLVLRGGAWNSSDYNVRSADRMLESPTAPNHLIGFRCLRSQ
jgi:formylglycine-generating enzyme required for sulfatase activity